MVDVDFIKRVCDSCSYVALPPSSQNGYWYNASYFEHLENSPLDIPKDRFEGYSVYCYDSAWTIALALNKTLTGIYTYKYMFIDCFMLLMGI